MCCSNNRNDNKYLLVPPSHCINVLNFSVYIFVNGTSLDFAKNLKKDVWVGKSESCCGDTCIEVYGGCMDKHTKKQHIYII